MNFAKSLLRIIGITVFCMYSLTGCGLSQFISTHCSIKPFLLADVKGKVGTQKITPPLSKGNLLGEETPWGHAGWARTWGDDAWEVYEFIRDVALDDFGNVLVAGHFEGPVDFSGGRTRLRQKTTSRGDTDGFISKWTSAGEFKWVRSMGGTSRDSSNGVATDSNGNVYVTGDFNVSIGFDDPPRRRRALMSNGQTDAFLVKYDESGNYQWARTWGGTALDRGLSVAVDDSDNVYVTGDFISTVDFDPGPGVVNRDEIGDHDAYLLKLDSDGNYQWVHTWGGSGFDTAKASAFCDDGSLYVAGEFGESTVDFSAGQLPNGWMRTSNGDYDVFLSKFNTDGGFLWAQAFGGTDEDRGTGVAACPQSGCVYISGYFKGSVDVPAGQISKPTTKHSQGETDGFICKFDSDGSFMWVRTSGGEGYDMCNDIAVGGTGNVYTTGSFWYTVNFGYPRNPDNRTSNGISDCFLVKLDTDGKGLWTRTWGGEEEDSPHGIAADPLGGVYVGGRFSGSVNFAPVGFESHTGEGRREMFLCSYPPDGNWGTKIEFKPGLKF